MKHCDLIMQERHRDAVHALLADTGSSEGAAYLLLGRSEIACDPWSRMSRTRYTSYEVIPIPDEDKVSASSTHVTWKTNSFVRLCRRAKAEGLVPAIVHNHPGGLDGFSGQDDRNERELYDLLRNRNGEGAQLVSLLQVGEETYRARVWQDGDAVPFSRVACIGSRLSVYDGEKPASNPAFARQALAFGAEVNERVGQIGAGVVGCGGTGSPVVHLLTRLGIGRIVAIDDDIVEASNLNRLHGATAEDAARQVPKVEVMAREVSRMGLGVDFHPIKGWVDAPDARDALKSCDVIFSCTDDHAGRIFLNRLSHFYLIPVIDVGLALVPNSDGTPGLQEMAARVTLLFPTAPCLMCRRIVSQERARGEDLKRQDPDEYERQKAEAYVVGGGNPAPSVVTFTTEAATMAVNELLQGLVDYRGEGSWAWQRYRRLDKVEERRQGVRPHDACPICGDSYNWGRGDVEPFLDRIG